MFADTQEPNEDDEDRDLPIVDRLLLGGELCDPNTGQNDTMYVYSCTMMTCIIVRFSISYGGSVDTNGNGEVKCRTDTVRIGWY